MWNAFREKKCGSQKGTENSKGNTQLNNEYQVGSEISPAGRYSEAESGWNRENKVRNTRTNVETKNAYDPSNHMMT